MNSGTRNALIFLLGLLMTSVLAAWFLGRYERAERELALPPRGEAAYNPLYALRQTLRADGVRAESRQRLDLAAMRLQPHDSVLLFGDPRALSKPDSDALLAWVERGGHLILRTPAADEDDATAKLPIFDALDVALEDGKPEHCLKLAIPGQPEHSEFCNGRRFQIDEDAASNLWGGSEDYAYARLPYGDGNVDLLADMDFLQNGSNGGNPLREDTPEAAPAAPGGGLRDVPHRLLARQILAPNYGHGSVYLIYSAELPSLWYTLFTRGWPAWLPALLMLLAWLWSRMQRFGPLQAAPAGDRRSLLEHVRASGEHLFRYGKSALLYAAMRQAFLTRLRRRAPLAAALQGPAQAAAIAERLNLPAAQIEQALQAPAPRQHLAFRDRIRLLVQMRNQL
ncbi:DUF4350 domain-containing protein [Xanthomonas translucens]|uniref:DUF4350 domain-containing protein n=2 Tax=Xanthomonas campestris pv. translucens TaxID=343 RepID=A0A109HRU6_XANCT|nr:DUF4350 domain-containing protein [Xanthomonas translucens]AVY65123.1 hypothetical protein NZ30_01635 [Xanthomonas translucens pv. undulosa]KWV16885.1 hypothetical protein ATB53_08735 [Xanthomonas translucens]QSQ33637.1 DUF4350 domain-containing protein [Xanthomonas translucens pv. translucens]QSQ45448.1 DUF4350 domain-containing protein [Xanthomonas translucens pv. translucens]UNU11288.1 DUF4350 domain-containing protein [Xanthomonas translucens pv. translucens]